MSPQLFVAHSHFLTAYMQIEWEVSMPVTLKDTPPGRRQCRVPAKLMDMLLTSLKGLPHLRLKPGVAAPTGPCQTPTPLIHCPASTVNATTSQPAATVEDVPDDGMEDVQVASPPHAHIHMPACAPAPEPVPPSQPVHPPIDMSPNCFSVFRCYATAPRSDPEEGLMLDAFADAGTHLCTPADPHECDPLQPFSSSARTWLSQVWEVAANSFAPFLNWSAFKLMEWQYTGSMMKSASKLQCIIDIVTDDHFKKEDLVGFSVTEAQRKLDDFRAASGLFSAKDGWHESSVMLRLPKPGIPHDKEADAPGAEVNKIWTRSLVEVIKSACQDATAHKFHWVPHCLLRCRAMIEEPDVQPEHLFSDVYNSDAMLREHEALQKQPPNPDDPPGTERVIAAIGMYSNSTRLANFGTTSLWPIYAYFLNLSKYVHLRLSAFAAHHLAYVPSVSTCCLSDRCL